MHRRILVLTLVAVLAGCDGGVGDGIEGFETACPTLVPRDGEACDLVAEARCLSDTGDCATAQVCACRNGVFECEVPDWDDSCAEIQNASCAIEGRHGCVGYPASGQRYCDGGEWLSRSSCSPGCPIEEETGLPGTGDACSVAEGGACDYLSTICDCVEGFFSCQAQ